MTSKWGSSELIRKCSKSSCNWTGTRKNSSNGLSLASRSKKTMSSSRSIGSRMTPKLGSLTYKYRNSPFKWAGSSRNLIAKSHPLRPVKYSWTRRQNSSRRNMIKDISCSLSGRRSPRLSPRGTRISTELVRNLPVWWINSMRINKF